MKKKLTILILIPIIATLLFSCSKTKDEMIVGKWEKKVTNQYGTTTITKTKTIDFFKDKTFNTSGGGKNQNLEGEYKLINDGTVLELTFNLPENKTEVLKTEILDITNEKLLLLNSENDTVIYKKVIAE